MLSRSDREPDLRNSNQGFTTNNKNYTRPAILATLYLLFVWILKISMSNKTTVINVDYYSTVMSCAHNCVFFDINRRNRKKFLKQHLKFFSMP